MSSASESDAVRIEAKQCVSSPAPTTCLNIVTSGSEKPRWQQPSLPNSSFKTVVRKPRDDVMVGSDVQETGVHIIDVSDSMIIYTLGATGFVLVRL